MAYGAKTYTLKQEGAEGGTRYSVALRTGRGNITNWKCQRQSHIRIYGRNAKDADCNYF